MNTTITRFFSQVILWAFIWIFLSLSLEETYQYLTEHAVLLLFQIVLIGLIIFYLAKKYLFTKKYFLFFIIVITIISCFSFTTSYFFKKPGIHPPIEHRVKPPRPDPSLRGPKENRNKPKVITPPSLFSVHLSVLMITFLVTTFLETFLFAQKKEKEIIKSKNENLQTELKLLKSQINPHFLFNSLNNIYALSVIDSNKTQQSISYLSDMLRYVLYECERPFVPIEKEITYIKNYIKLFALKSSKIYPITTDFKVQDHNVSIAPMLFIPFIENAFKHSNIEKFNGSFINISVDAASENIKLIVENSIPKEKIHKDGVGGIGLENVKKRLSILYPNKHQLTIEDQNSDIFTVTINIKLTKNA